MSVSSAGRTARPIWVVARTAAPGTRWSKPSSPKRNRAKRRGTPRLVPSVQAQRISDVDAAESQRIQTNIGELDRVLGGGLVPGSVVLVGGDPGIGKSTLVLQAAAQLGGGGAPSLYASGEESTYQIKLRAERLGVSGDNVLVVSESNLNEIIALAEQSNPSVLIVDSIQTTTVEELETSAGSVGQVRESTAQLIRWAKPRMVPVIIIGHVTKEGNIAGPRVLEHMVDAVLYLEGERFQQFRILRAVKNRFGSTDEVGVFEMAESGLQEVRNPSEAFLQERALNAAGSTVTVTLEGSRPILVEVQALDVAERLRTSAPERQRIRSGPSAAARRRASKTRWSQSRRAGRLHQRGRWPAHLRTWRRSGGRDRHRFVTQGPA